MQRGFFTYFVEDIAVFRTPTQADPAVFLGGATNRTRLSRCFVTVSPKAIQMPEYTWRCF